MHILSWIYVSIIICLSTNLIAAESIEVTDVNFAQVVFEKPSLIKFYSPYCGHCKNLAPTWEAAAAAIHSQHPNIQLVSLDCTKFGDICNKFAVRGYPTIKLVRPSESDAALTEYVKQVVDPPKVWTRWVYEYENGPRTVLGFEQFVTDESQWSKAKRSSFPLEVPPHPEILKVLTRDQRASDAVDKAEQLNDNDQPLKVASVVANMNDIGALSPSDEVTAKQSTLLHDALWLVVGLLIVACAYWMYLTLRVNGKLSKFT